MRFNPEEITSVLRKEIEEYRSDLDVAEVGTILEVGDGIARIYGLDRAMAGEMLEFESGVRGQVFNLEEDSIGAIILGDYKDLKEGETVRRTGALLEVPVGEGLIGRVVDPLGNPLDGKGPIQRRDDAPGRDDRPRHRRPAAGEGAAADGHQGHRRHDPHRPRPARADHRRPQDRQDRDRASTRSSTRRPRTSICVYVAIGQKESTVAGIVEDLRNARRDGLHDRRRGLVGARPAPLQYIAPVRRLRDGRVLHVHAQAPHAAASTTT